MTPVLNLIVSRPTVRTPQPSDSRHIWRVRCETCGYYEGGITTGESAILFAELHNEDTGHKVDVKFLVEIHHTTIRSELDREANRT